MECGKSNQVERYHDDELSPSDRQAMEAHLRGCAACRAQLSELRGLSRLLCEAPTAALSGNAVERMQLAWHAARDRGVVRAAGWLTVAAAAVLIAALLTSPASQVETGPRPPIWQTAMLTPPAGVHDEVVAETAVTAQWMAEDLLSSETR